MEIIITGLTTIIFLSLLWIVYTDIRYRIISNRAVVIIFILSLLLGVSRDGTINYALALSFLLVGFVLFYFNVVGAGDIKLISALSLSLTLDNAWLFLWFTAVLGGLIALFGLLFFHKSIRRSGVPYGPAIAGGFLLILFTR